jgi:hypothetical protein
MELVEKYDPPKAGEVPRDDAAFEMRRGPALKFGLLFIALSVSPKLDMAEACWRKPPAEQLRRKWATAPVAAPPYALRPRPRTRRYSLEPGHGQLRRVLLKAKGGRRTRVCTNRHKKKRQPTTVAVELRSLILVLVNRAGESSARFLDVLSPWSPVAPRSF